MKLSYIIPVYNVEEYLEKCINSILSQIISDYEIILVDDGSTDNSGKICDKYSEKHNNITVIHTKNSGISIARNKGLSIAKGKYVFFIDSDDYLINDSIESLLNIADTNNLDILNNTFYTSNNSNDFKQAFNENKLYSRDEMKNELVHANMNRILVFVWRNLYRRDFLIQNNITFPDELHSVEDSVFNMQCYSKCERFMAVNIPVYCYRIREDSIQRTKYKVDYDLVLQKQWELKNKYFTESFSEVEEYKKDSAEFTIKVLLPDILKNEYINKKKDKYKKLKRTATCNMVTESFNHYDINNFKSKSLDWIMTWAIKNKLYLLSHIICKYILYK